MREEHKNLLAVFGQLCGILILIVVNLIFDGWVLKTLWTWFLVPLFPVRALLISEAIGVALVAALLTHQFSKQEEGDFGKRLAWSMTAPALFLFTGWCVHLCQ
jgi:hypothetical protein